MEIYQIVLLNTCNGVSGCSRGRAESGKLVRGGAWPILIESVWIFKSPCIGVLDCFGEALGSGGFLVGRAGIAGVVGSCLGIIGVL